MALDLLKFSFNYLTLTPWPGGVFSSSSITPGRVSVSLSHITMGLESSVFLGVYYVGFKNSFS